MATNTERITALEKWRTAHDALHAAKPLHSHAVLVPPPSGGVAFAGDWTAAIAAAPANGNLINVPAGPWPSPVIRPYAGLTIRGVPGAIITRVGVPNAPDVGLIDVRVAGVTIEGLTIRGTFKTNPGAGDDTLIYGVGSTGLTVRNCILEDANGIGIQTRDASGMLFEDLIVRNVGVRSNGAHGVAVWPYHGTKTSTFRRLIIDGAVYAGLFLDAGTSVGTASSVDDNVLEDVTVKRAAKGGGIVGVGAGVMVTGAKRNAFLRTTVSDQTQGPAFAFGIDQSGLTSLGNRFTTTTIAAISSGIAASFDPTADGNTFDGATGAGRVVGSAGNTFLNVPWVLQ